jgi:hypothetical protein
MPLRCYWYLLTVWGAWLSTLSIPCVYAAGVPVYFIRPADWNQCNLFKGGAIYKGSYDEREAYLFMCR